VKTLIVGPASKGLQGGQVTHMSNLRELFGKDLNFFYSSSGKEGTEFLGLKVVRLIFMWIVFPFFVFNKSSVHINSSFDNKAGVRDIYLFLVCLALRKNTIIQYHGGIPNRQRVFCNNAFRKLLSFVYARTTVLVLTEEQKLWVESLNAHKVKLLTNYVKIPSNQSLLPEPIKLLYIGRIVEAKGVLNIVRAMARCSHLSLEMNLYGQGEDEDKLRSLIDELGLSSKVKFLGPVSGNSKEQALLSSSIFLYPSHYPEGVPYSILEALSYGLAVVCTDAGALGQLLEEGVECVRVEKNSVDSLLFELENLVQNRDLLCSIASNGYQKVYQHHSMETMKSQLKEVWLCPMK